MRIMLHEFVSDLRVHRLRAVLTLFAVFWGTLTVVLLLAFGEGLKRSVMDGLTGAGNQMFIVYGGQTSRPFEGLPQGRSIRLTEDDLDVLLHTIPEIDGGSASYGRSGTVVASEHLTTTTMMEGVHPDFAELRTLYPAAGGRFLNDRDVAERRRVVFLGDAIARRLFPNGDAIGGTVDIDGVPFTVVGVMLPKLQTSMNNGPDADRAVIPASTFRTLYGSRNVNQLLLRPRTIAAAPQVKQRVYEVLGRRHGFHADDERALSFWDFVEQARITGAIGLGIQLFLGAVGMLTLAVAGIGVANIMYVVVKERTREIGIKRALGAPRRLIQTQFVVEAILVAATGGLAGFAVAAAIVLGVAALPDGNEAMQMIGNPRLSLPIGLAVAAVLIGIGVAAGAFPARRAAAVDPVEALRYE